MTFSDPLMYSAWFYSVWNRWTRRRKERSVEFEDVCLVFIYLFELNRIRIVRIGSEYANTKSCLREENKNRTTTFTITISYKQMLERERIHSWMINEHTQTDIDKTTEGV